MPSSNAVANAEYKPEAGRELTVPQALVAITPDAGDANAAMYKLSKRLWSIEVFRRLEIQTRRVLEA